MAAQRILIVDDQMAVREELAYALTYDGYRTAEAANGEAGLAIAAEGDVAVVLLDIKMPGMDGMQVLQRLRETRPELPVIMISGHGDIETAVVAVRNGAFDFLPKPFDTDRVLVSVKNALRVASLATENTALRQELARGFQLLGQSGVMQEVRRVVQRVAPTEATVLITGENGTGKELVARQIHLQSRRSKGPLVTLNCAAIPSELIESELFGHERGAFTGANTARQGHFEAADGGTLFLDEIGDMAVEAQAKLLRALQEQVVVRVGGSKPTQVDVRVVAATNQDLQEMVQNRTFREDLYYRLHVIRVQMPALRDRIEDVEELALFFLSEACKRNGLPKRRLGKDAIAFLRGQPWPGNVRELKNRIEAAAILAESDELTAAELRATVVTTKPHPGTENLFAYETIEDFRAAAEKEFIRRKLLENSGNIKRTAERIQLQRSNLYKKLERYGLK